MVLSALHRPDSRHHSPAIVHLIVLTALLSCALAWPTSSAAQTPIQQGARPRLLLTNADLPALRARLGPGGSGNADAVRWRQILDAKFDTIVVGTSQNDPGRGMLLGYAFAWLLRGGTDGGDVNLGWGHTRDQYGQKAKAMLEDFYTRLGSWDYVDWYWPIAYDWIHPLLSPAWRQDFATIFLKGSADHITLSGTYSELFNSQGVTRRVNRLLTGLALANDGIDNAWAAGVVAEFPYLMRRDPVTNLRTGNTAIESFVSGWGGGIGQGLLYGIAYVTKWLVLVEEAYRTANGISREVHYGSPDASVLRYLPAWHAYQMVPDAFPRTSNPSYPDGYNWHYWKGEKISHPQPIGDGALLSIPGMFATVDPNMAGLARWLRDHRIQGDNDTGIQQWWVPFWLVIGNHDVAAKSPAQAGLPTSAFLERGVWVFRKDWTDIPIGKPYVAYVAQTWWTHSMGPIWPGEFYIHRKGPMVQYQGGIMGHDTQYPWQMNALTFPDLSRTSPLQYDTFGGPRGGGTVTPSVVNQYLPGSYLQFRGTTRQLLAADDRDVDYVYTDLTRFYDSSLASGYQNPIRLDSSKPFIRQFVYFHPANALTDSVRVVVFDRATTLNPYNWTARTGQIGKVWQFHPSTEPTINGTVTPGPSRGPTGTDGKWQSTDAVDVVSVNTRDGADGKVWLTPLFPTSRVIVKVGGPNGTTGLSWRSGVSNPGEPDATKHSHEYENIYGQQDNGPYAIYDPGSRVAYVGQHRIEVIPTTATATDVFVNVIEAGDSTATKTPTQGIQGLNFIGARVGNRVAMFAESNDNEGYGTFVVTQPGTYKILVAGLRPGGEYTVTVGGASSTQTTSPAGTLYLEQTLSVSTQFTLQATGVVVTPPSSPPGSVIIR